MNFIPNMFNPNNMPTNNIDMYINDLYNRINDFDNRLKRIEQRLMRLENNNTPDYHYQEPDNSLYMI